MKYDITFHYPPELMNLLIQTIPLLNRSKKDVFIFFRGAGVSENIMEKTYDKWAQNRDSINKFDIVREILVKLNEQGEICLRERREILKRVTDIENYSVCWPADQLKAKGLVSEIREVVDVKDSFTRMRLEREQERTQRLEKVREEQKALQIKKVEIEQVSRDLAKLFSITNPHQRGKSLEGVLNRLFKAYDISVRESFHIIGSLGEGIVEQIDGVIELDSQLYFVEIKWWNIPLGIPEISEHLVRVYHRAESRAIIISASDFTSPAITTCKEALVQKVVLLCTLKEIVFLLEHQGDLKEFIKKKSQAAIIDKNPFYQL